jgi:lipooligosaccharide biosynthesis protein lex-1
MPVEPDFERRKVIKKIFRNREIRLLENFHYGTAGYIINYNAVIMLYDLFREIEINDIKPIDVLMFNDFLKSSKLNIYQLIPALCVQDTILNKDNASLNSMISRNKMKGNRLTILELISNLIDKPNRMKKKKLAKLTIVKFK